MITEDAVRAALGDVTDPEYPVSIVDLGMVYRVAVRGDDVDLDLTFTSIGCPAMDDIVSDAREAVARLPGAGRVTVNVVWSPPWTRERITERGRRLLACCGVVA
jgi:metal-sulfur cluster biosynthetic enzyme